MDTVSRGPREKAPGSPLNRKSEWPLFSCRLSDSPSHAAGREQRVDRTRICLSWQWPEPPRHVTCGTVSHLATFQSQNVPRHLLKVKPCISPARPGFLGGGESSRVAWL